MDEMGTPLSVSGQFSFCSLPLRLDSYRGCGFACSYCFARTRGGNSSEPQVIPGRSGTLGRILSRTAAQEDPTSTLAQMLARRIPVHFGGMSDPFQPVELRHRRTLEYLKALVEADYPTVISTKGDLLLRPEYVDLLTSGFPVVVQFSITSTVDSKAEKVERSATPPSALLLAMETLSRAGVTVTCRWQPVIPSLAEKPRKYVSTVSSAGAQHVAVEHLKVPLEGATSATDRDASWLGREKSRYLSAGANRDGREYLLPTAAKIDRVLEVRRLCHERSISFGAADNELQFMSDGEACCSGVDRFLGFENVFKHQIGAAVRRAVGSQKIKLSRIGSEWAPTKSIDRWLNSRSRLADRLGVTGTVEDHIQYRWNTPSAPSNPLSFFGVTRDGVDASSGMALYAWDAELKAKHPEVFASAAKPKPRRSKALSGTV